MARISTVCQIELNNYEFLCLKPAHFFVTYFTDGDGGKSACGMHLSKAVNVVLDAPNVRGVRVSVVRLERLTIGRLS